MENCFRCKWILRLFFCHFDGLILRVKIFGVEEEVRDWYEGVFSFFSSLVVQCTNLNLRGVTLEWIMAMIFCLSFSDKEADLDFCIT
jgi:hypothetical protein